MRVAVARLAAVQLGVVAALSLSGPTGGASQRTVLDLGDSLSVGAAQYLSTRPETYRIERIHDIGLHAYDAAAIVAERRPTLPPVIVVSAGSNDDRSTSRTARAGSSR